MNIVRKSELGFGAVEVLIVLVVTALIGGVGYVAYKNLNTAKQVAVTNNTSAPKPTPPAPTDPYAGWQQYCSAGGAVCFQYPTDWKIATTQTADPSIPGAAITSPSGKITVEYIPIVAGFGGDCNPNTCFFNTDSITKPQSKNPGNLKVVKGIYTNKDTPAILTYYYVSSDDQISNYKLAVNQNVDVGFFMASFTNPHPTSQAVESFQVRNVPENDFSSVASAESWFTNPEVVTAGKVLSSISLK